MRWFEATGYINPACGPFAKSKERIKKIKETRNLGHIYQSELGKACFQHDISFGILKIYLEK